MAAANDGHLSRPQRVNIICTVAAMKGCGFIILHIAMHLCIRL